MNNKIILLLLTFIFAGSAFCNTDAAKAQGEEVFPELLPSSEVLKKQSPKTEFKAARPADTKTNNKSDVKTIMNITPVSNTVKASEKDLNEVTNSTDLKVMLSFFAKTGFVLRDLRMEHSSILLSFKFFRLRSFA